MTAALCRAAPLGFLMLLPNAAFAQKVEQPPAFRADRIAGIAPVGANYTIHSPVASNGLLRVCVLETPYGVFTVQGDDMVRMRLNELAALELLEKVSQSESFTTALANAGLSPVKYAGRLLTSPVETVKDTFAGIGAVFGRIGSGLNNAGKTQDNALAGLLGVTGEKRALAATYGVDTYTDFPPLKAKLDQLSEAAALGGLTVSGALLIVPGAAGIVVSNLSTAYKLNDIGLEDLARNFTAAQIMDLNRERLEKMGVDKELTERLLANRNFTPIDLAAMVAALDSMQSVEDREVFAAWAVTADARYFAYFVRRQAELMADDNRRHRNYRRLVSLAGYPFAATGDGRLHTLSPIDALAWTKETEDRFGDMSAARREIAPKARVDLRITGQATALTKKKLKAQAWTLSERQKP